MLVRSPKHRVGRRVGTRTQAQALARFYNRWVIERSWRAKEEADPLSVFDRDPDDGPESEGLLHYEDR